jgi:HEAT repeat protein
MLKDEDEDVRQAAVEAFGKFGTKDDLPKIEKLLKDEDKDVRQRQ